MLLSNFLENTMTLYLLVIEEINTSGLLLKIELCRNWDILEKRFQ